MEEEKGNKINEVFRADTMLGGTNFRAETLFLSDIGGGSSDEKEVEERSKSKKSKAKRPLADQSKAAK